MRPTAPSPAALDAELSSVLHARGQRVTSQRLLVHRIVRLRGTHLTAEQVFAAARMELPATSLPTIYATLELLGELGALRQVSAGGRRTLYDGRVEPHAHAVCRDCGSIRDIDEGAAVIGGAMDAAARDGSFAPERAETVVHGLCEHCR